MPNAQEVLDWLAWKDREKKLKENMTNEEWFCSLSTEEKAKVLNDTFWKCLNYVDEHELVDDDISEIYLRWLKEKHE